MCDWRNTDDREGAHRYVKAVRLGRGKEYPYLFMLIGGDSKGI